MPECDIRTELFFRKACHRILRFRRAGDGLWISPVKFLSVLLAIPVIAHATPGDPGAAALDFLEKVRERKINLEPGGNTALSSQTADEKKHQIARRLDRMAKDLGSDPLELGEVKLDEDYAAVLVRKNGGFDPGRLQIFPVALVKRGAEWLAAPMPASFENAGAGYAVALKKRLESLETWMLREQVVDLEKLRAQSAGKMRHNIETRLTGDELRSYDARQAAEHFLSACGNRDLPSVLGFLGGLSSTLPDDWPARLKAADHALGTGIHPSRPWRLLSSPEVMRVLEKDSFGKSPVTISLACLDPAGTGSESSPPQVETVFFDLVKDADGLWQVNLPQDFLSETDEPADDPQEEDPLNGFSTNWIELHPPMGQESAELARQAVVKALAAATLEPLLRISKFDPNPEHSDVRTSNRACIQAAQLWWLFHSPSSVRQAIPLDWKSEGTTAAATFQFFSSRDPDRPDLRTLYFERYPGGWLWTPVPTSQIREKFKEWVDSQAKIWPSKWQDALLAGSLVISKIEDQQAPSEGDARQCVEAWSEAIRRGDPRAALDLVARLDDPRSGYFTLQNLGYELLGARQEGADLQITGIYTGRKWCAVGVKAKSGGKITYPLYPVIQTPQGPRILLEIDLFAAGNRGRDFLNRAAITRLDKYSSAEGITELRNLYSQHQTQVQAGIATEKPLH